MRSWCVRSGRDGEPRSLDRLARDLRAVFPDMGMSARNLKYMRAFARAWQDREIVQGRLAQLSWWHQIALLEKLDSSEVRLWYAEKAGELGWTRELKVGDFKPEYAAAQWRLPQNRADHRTPAGAA